MKQKKAIVIHSPHSGRSNLLTEALTDLQKTNIELVNVLSIAELDSLPHQGDDWRRNGIDLVIAAGGDGVVGGVITHIAESGLPLGILPLGTANDIARSLSIPQHPRQAVQVLATGRILTIDIGKAEPAEQTPHTANGGQKQPVQKQVEARQQGYFAHALTLGVNVQFARLATNVVTRKHFGRLTYPLSALNVLFNHTAVEMEIRLTGLALPAKDQNPTIHPTILSEEIAFRSRALQATVINAPIFGGQWHFTIPRASLDDHLLDVVIIDDIGSPDPLATLIQRFNRSANDPETKTVQQAPNPQIQAAELSKIPGIHHVQARGVVITTTIDPQDATLDGEVRGQTPMHVSLAEYMLHVFVP